MRAYLDHNATTPLRPEARERWLEVARSVHGNPSSLHAAGRAARAVVDEARDEVARALSVAEDEVVFTSGGTESNNLALFGVLEALGPGAGLVTTAAEHSSVLAPARALAARGHPVRITGVDRKGRPDPGELLAAAGEPGTGLMSVMAANNEVGTVPDLPGIASELAALGGSAPLLHVDAVQALGRLPLGLGSRGGWGCALASFSAHKVGGPSGVGMLYRRRGTPLAPRARGGGQELELRPGTENVAGIAAAARAFGLAVREQEAVAAHTRELLRFLWNGIADGVPGVQLVGPAIDAPDRLPNTLSILLPGVDGRVLVTRLDLEGLEVSAGSACASGSLEPSHVLRAMGYDDEEARAGLRLSLGGSTSRAECKHAVDVLKKLGAASRAT